MPFARPNAPASADGPSSHTALKNAEIANLTIDQKIAQGWQDEELRHALESRHTLVHEDPTKAAILKRWILWGNRPALNLVDALDARDDPYYGWDNEVYWRGLKAPFVLEDEEEEKKGNHVEVKAENKEEGGEESERDVKGADGVEKEKSRRSRRKDRWRSSET